MLRKGVMSVASGYLDGGLVLPGEVIRGGWGVMRGWVCYERVCVMGVC